MEVFMKGIKNYPEDPTRYFEFSRYNHPNQDLLLVNNLIDCRLLEDYKDKKIIYLEFEEPNRFFLSDNPIFKNIELYEDYFYKIFTICPYTAAWLNNKYGNNKRTPVFFPFNDTYTPVKSEKIYDVIYSGHIFSDYIQEISNTISKFNYRLISGSHHQLVTDKNVNYIKKLELISKSRVCIVHNLLFLNKHHLKMLYQTNQYRKNQAFKLVLEPCETFKSEILVPQIKSRVFEAAFCKSLILCRRDPFNIIENFFTPDVDFLYFEENELEKKLSDVLKHYDSYEHIIKNAFIKATSQYTTNHFFDKFLKDLS